MNKESIHFEIEIRVDSRGHPKAEQLIPAESAAAHLSNSPALKQKPVRMSDEPCAGPMFLQIFHGRRDPNQEMDDWGEQGPIFACPDYVHTTYASDIKLG